MHGQFSIIGARARAASSKFVPMVDECIGGSTDVRLQFLVRENDWQDLQTDNQGPAFFRHLTHISTSVTVLMAI